jgi:hypothetical protein
MRNWIVLALAATATATSVAVPLAAHYLNKPGDDALAEALRRYGFMPINPPSTLMNVGSLYYVDSSARTFTSICAVAKSDIDDAIIKSRSWDMQENLERKGRFTTGVKVNLASLLEGGGEGSDNYVQKVHSSLTDIVLEELPLGASSLIFAKMMEKPECKKVAMELLGHGGFVCQGQKLLQATAEFKLGLDGASKIATKAKVAPDKIKDAVKVAIEAQSEQSVVERQGRLFAGAALQYGVSMNPTCLAPLTARFQRVLPRSTWDRVVNFVLFNIVEPMLPAKADEMDMTQAHAANKP